jgi:hypothetical protein
VSGGSCYQQKEEKKYATNFTQLHKNPTGRESRPFFSSKRLAYIVPAGVGGKTLCNSHFCVDAKIFSTIHAKALA